MALTQIPLVAGVLLAWSLAAPPGPINALMAHAAARRGFAAGWGYGLGAMTGDMTMLAHAGGARLKRFSEFVSYAAAIALAVFAAGLFWYAATNAWAFAATSA